VIGREHRRRGRGGQDAAAVVLTDGIACAVVCDGCSSGEASEVGARLSARWIATHAPRLRRAIDDDAALAEAVVAGLVAHLGRVADDLVGASEGAGCVEGAVDDARAEERVRERSGVVGSMLLATALVALIDTREGGRALVFGVGDGALYAGDGATRLLDAEVVRFTDGADGGGAPAYPAYRLLTSGALDARTLDDARWLAPRLHFTARSADVDVLAIATDGAADLEAQRGASLRDGSRVDGLAELASDPRLATNPSLLGKRLYALGEVHGRLADDTTIAVLARVRRATGALRTLPAKEEA
jgi:hypothetical protein